MSRRRSRSFEARLLQRLPTQGFHDWQDEPNRREATELERQNGARTMSYRTRQEYAGPVLCSMRGQRQELVDLGRDDFDLGLLAWTALLRSLRH